MINNDTNAMIEKAPFHFKWWSNIDNSNSMELQIHSIGITCYKSIFHISVIYPASILSICQFDGKYFASFLETDANISGLLSNLQKVNKSKLLKACKYYSEEFPKFYKTLHETWSFPFRIYSANTTKSAVSCWFGHIY